VQHIQVCDEGGGGDSIERLAPIALKEMVKQWAQEHFSAGSGHGTLRVLVKEAFVQEIPLAPQSGIQRIVRIENSEKYVGRIRIAFEFVPQKKQGLGRIVVHVSREKYVPENFSIKERRALLLCLYEDLINQLTLETDKAISEMLQNSGDA
jgi:hypothetical protein